MVTWFFDVGPTLYKCDTNVSCLLGSQCSEFRFRNSNGCGKKSMSPWILLELVLGQHHRQWRNINKLFRLDPTPGVFWNHNGSVVGLYGRSYNVLYCILYPWHHSRLDGNKVRHHSHCLRLGPWTYLNIQRCCCLASGITRLSEK